jgi:hypothetical protein
MDNSLFAILFLICAYTVSSLYNDYFRNGNKFVSDEDLMQRYVFLTMKQRNVKHYPNMEIK